MGRSGGVSTRNSDSGGVRRLTLGGGAEPPEPRAPEPPTTELAASKDLDLVLFERRCRLKAEACDWAERRQRLTEGGADFRAEVRPYDEILERAGGLPGCYLWMCSPDAPAPQFDGAYELLARNFETLSDALAHARRVEEKRDDFPEALERAIDLLAEAQSAVRVAVMALGRERGDFDQNGVHLWLRETTSPRQAFVGRHMRADDPASPTGWAELAARIDSEVAKIEAGLQAAARRSKLLGRVRHKALLIERGQDVESSWRILVESVETILADGLPPSDRRLRDTLASVFDEAPEWAAESEGLQLLAREFDRELDLAIIRGCGPLTSAMFEGLGMTLCEHCERDRRDECNFSCHICGRSWCSGCFTDICYCPACVISCRQCGELCCENCLGYEPPEEGLCETCNEKNEVDNETQHATAEAGVAADAVRLG